MPSDFSPARPLRRFGTRWPLGQAWHSLRRQPLHSLGVVIVLGLAIGAAAAVAGAVRGLLLTPPPFAAPQQLQRLQLTQDAAPGRAARTLPAWSYPAFEALRDALGTAAPLAAYTPHPIQLNLAAAEAPERVGAEFVSANYFDVLGVAPRRGRAFLAQDDRAGAAPVALLGEALWRARFGARPEAVGSDLQLDGRTVRVIGVLPAGFRGVSESAQLWLPMAQAPTFTFPQRLSGALSFWHGVVLRAPAPEALAARLPALARAVGARIDFRPALGAGAIGVTAQPLLAARVDPGVRRVLAQLGAAVALLLLVAIGNVAHLALAAWLRRQRELGVRAAVGAGRGDLVRLLLAEALWLALASAALALLVAALLQAALHRLGALPDAGGPAPTPWPLDPASAALCLGLALLAVAVASLAPLRAAWSLRLHLALLGKGLTRRLRGLRLGLAAAQLALAALLSVGACWLGSVLWDTYRAPLPFQVDGVLAARASLPPGGGAGVDAAGYFPALAEAARRLPGVEAAAVANCLPLQDGCDRVVMRGEGVGVGDDSPRSVALNMVEPDYFRTLGIAVLRGRGFAPGDREGAPRVAIVSRSVAQRDFGDADPVGQRIVLSMDEVPATIVGVAADVTAAPGESAPMPLVYLPFAQVRYEDNYVVLRSAGDPHLAIAPLRAASRQRAAGVALWDIATLGERLDGLVARLRLATALLGGLGLLALLLAGAGLFSVLNLLVAQRTAEFGLRLAVGATPRHVLALVLRDAAAVLGAGLGLAVLVAALLLPRYGGDALFRAAALDARAFAAAGVLLALCVLAAALLPARRALAVDPLVTLRQD